jgi:murein DD-endopeptidase MepM/ murein hydrolase activator NlpD
MRCHKTPCPLTPSAPARHHRCHPSSRCLFLHHHLRTITHARQTTGRWHKKRQNGTARGQRNTAKGIKSKNPLLPIVAPGVGEPVTCTGPPHKRSAPFLSAPYAGYAEIASFFDHDQPDYAIDGTIITTTGLTVHSSDGVTGIFPSYWAAQLRQYISYDGHNGYDYDIAYQPVLAAASGKVSFAGWESSNPYYGYGQMILIHHRYGYITLYGHLSKILVKVGQHVRAGQVIAISGTSGHSTGPHLHFSVYHNCHVVDPYGWTGPGKDPLAAFNGEESTYLWRKGEAPLILNPLPNWPDFGAGHLPIAPTPLKPHPITHLLLLHVPQARPGPPALSLASIEQQLTDEQEQLFALLDALKSKGLVQSYSLLPGAGAVRVQGLVSPQQLMALPGVASILGNRTKDLVAANNSLAHALNEAMGPPPNLSLFPSTYLDSAWSWRLSVSVEENGPYVLGYARPGSHVSVWLRRHGHVVSSNTAITDPASGAFAVYLTDRAGHLQAIHPGDSISVACNGKSTTVFVVPLSITADPLHNRLDGYGPSGTSIELMVKERLNGRQIAAMVQTPEHSSGHWANTATSRYSTRIAGHLAVGDIIIASLPDASGNTVFTWTRVPGFMVTEGSNVVQGWAKSGTNWRADVFNNGHWLASATSYATVDGYLAFKLTDRRGSAHALQPGNSLRLQKLAHPRATSIWLHLPRFTGMLHIGQRSFTGYGPANSSLYIRMWDDTAERWRVTSVHTGRSGWYTISLSRPALLGDAVDAIYADAMGDLVENAWATRGIIIHLGSSQITGYASPGETLVLRVFSPQGHLLGIGTANTDTHNGAFTAQIFGIKAKPIMLQPGDSVSASDSAVTTTYHAANMTIKVAAQRDTIWGWIHGHGHVAVALWSGHHELGQIIVPLASNGHFVASLRNRYPLAPGDRVEALYGTATSGSSAVQATVSGPLTKRLAALDRALHVLSWIADGKSSQRRRLPRWSAGRGTDAAVTGFRLAVTR